MPNVQEIDHEKKPLLGQLAFLDIRISQDIGNADLANAFTLQIDLRVLGAVVGSTGAVPLKNGSISLQTPGGAAQGTVNDMRFLDAERHPASGAHARTVAFRIDGTASPTIPGPLGMKINVNLAHADFAVPIHAV